MTDSDILPKVTPYLLRRANDLCPRRLALEVEGATGSADPVHRSRMRDAFLRAARDAHAELRPPTAAHFARVGDGVEPEEAAVLRHAATWYVRMFGHQAVTLDSHSVDQPTTLPWRGIRLGGWVDLLVIDGEGRRELRQLDLWAGRLPHEAPLELEAAKVAVLRIAQEVGVGPLHVVWADLVRGLRREQTIDPERDLPSLATWLDGTLAELRARTAEPLAVSGEDCGSCRHVSGCPAHPTGANASTRRGDVRPGILTLTPSTIESWRRCPREWRDRSLLGIPASDEDGSGSSNHGIRMHALLRFLHAHGSCTDATHVEEVLDGHGLSGDARVRDALDRHVQRCPRGARAIGHEHTVARFHRLPLPLFMATARIDALWEHDGVLDARDYKTGRAFVSRLAHDPQARLQGWVLAPLAAQLGLQVRVQFEQLATEVDEDPEPFEPDDDDLALIEEELRAVASEMRDATGFAGVADAAVCTTCRYRSICPDSATPSVPIWPGLEPEDAEVSG